MTSLPGPAIKLISCHAFLTALAALAVVLRVAAGHVRKRAFRSHDYFAFWSLICLFGYVFIIDYGAVHGGIGLHTAQLQSTRQATIGLKAFYGSQYFFTTVTASNRISILLLYVGIFRRKWFLIASYIVAALVIGWWIGSQLTSLLICRPINRNWDPNVNGTCGDVFKVELASASFNLILDLTLVILPMPVLWALQMARTIKLQISAVFGLGIVIAAVNVGRIIQTALSNQQDFTYVAVDASILAVAEAAIGLIVVCAPTLGPIFAPGRFKDTAYSDRPVLQHKPYTGLSDQTSNRSAYETGASKSDIPKHLSSDFAMRDDDFELGTHES